MSTPITPISAARARLVVNQPWFASLAFRLDIRENASCPTAQTNGVFLEYNPDFYNSLTPDIQESVLAHEVMHCALLHFARRGHRDPAIWNMAGDHVINLELLQAGFKLPKGCLHDTRFTNMTTEEVYAQLIEEGAQPPSAPDPLGAVIDLVGEILDAMGQPNGAGKQPGQPGSAPGEGGNSPDNDPDSVAIDWQIAVGVADMLTAKAGIGSPSASRACKSATAPKLAVSAIIEKYFRIKEDSSWERPNKRFIGRGQYMPAKSVSKLGTMVIGVDTSGSIDQNLLAIFGGIVEQLVDQAGFPDRLVVIYCDDRVQKVEELHEGGIKLAAHGGGGTKFQPVFDWVTANSIEPDVLFYLTDLDCYDRPIEPEYPVVWIAPKYSQTPIPGFGELIQIDTGNRN